MKVVYLPLDERPCNSKFAQRIAQGTDVEVISAPLSILGNKKIPANSKEIERFLLENAKEADCFVIATDMLLYGGIVPSRLHHLNEEELTCRLNVLDKIKEINPKVKIYCFALITRCPSYSSADEEPDYYEHCGREIFIIGQIKHKIKIGLIEKQEEGDLLLLAECEKKVGAAALSDFESRRAINRLMLERITSRLGSSIDFLVIPQDDSSPYGYTTMDREYLKERFRAEGKDIAMYPGADEVGMTLLSKAVCDFYGRTPKIYCKYPKDECENVIPLYEDRPIKETLPFQIHSAGCEFADADSADIILYLNYPTRQPVNIGEEMSAGYAERDIDAFCKEISESVRKGLRVAVADCAFCNGGEIELLRKLCKDMDIFKLCAYAGWNTSSNTLGTVICQSVFAYVFGKNAHSDNFLADRFYEDVGYCGYVRKYVVDNILPDMKLGYFDAGEEDGEVASVVREELEKYISANLPSVARRYRIDICRMPWRRMFEVDVTTVPKA